MKARFYSIFLILFGLPIFAFSQQNLELFERISTKNGLSQSVVTSILQDSKGFIWVGTQDGLNRYDGYSFKIFKTKKSVSNSISGNYIQAICEDRNGNIWIGTKDKGLNKYDRKTERFERYNSDSTNLSNSLSDSSVTSVFEDSKGVLWIGTANGLNSFDYKTNRFSKFTLINESVNTGLNTINSISEDKDQNLWVGTENGLIKIAASRKTLKTYRNNSANKTSISDNQIHVIFVDKEGEVYIGTNQGFDIYNKFLDSFIRIQFNNQDQGIEIYSITQDKRGNLWIGTFGNGLIRYNKKQESFSEFVNIPSFSQSLSCNYIFSLCIDRSGLLWVGTYGDEGSGGINKLDLTRIKFNKLYAEAKNDNSLLSNDINAIFEDSQANIWIGTDKGISIFNQKNRKYSHIQKKNTSKSLSDNTVYSIIQDSRKNFWIGTASGGVNFLSYSNFINQKFEFSYFQTSSKYNKISSNNILSLIEDKTGIIWVGTDNGINRINENGQVIDQIVNSEATPNVLPDNLIQCLFQDLDNKIWIGTSQGLAYFDKMAKKFVKPNIPVLASKISVYCITQDSDGFLWLGTEGAGIIRIDVKNNIGSVYTTKNGLPDNYIYGILPDQQNNLWLSTNTGLSRMVKGTLSNYTIINYSSGKWLNYSSNNVGFNIGAFHKNNGGVIYFGCSEGVLYFNPLDIRGNIFIPPVVFTSFQLGLKEVEISPLGETPLKESIAETKEVEVPLQHKRITIEFAALNYIESEKNEYAYKLEGVDDDWIYSKNVRRAEYSGLSHGTYIFRIKASNNNGIWNEEGAVLKIVIPPPFWQTVWFILILIVSGVFSIVWWNRKRLSRIRQQKEQLEVLVEQRTEEIMQQKEEIQEKAELLRQANEELNTTNEELNATLENLKTAQTQLIESEKMASLGQLTAGVAHEINNPINFISGNVPPLKRDIDDILSILNQYEHLVSKHGFQLQFEEVYQLKKELDYDYVVDEINNLINGISEGATRTTAIVKGLRNFSRLDEDDMKLANINEGLESTILILRNKIKNKAEVITHYGQIPEVICYPGKINQVFMNIINNAVDALDEHGEIVVSTSINEHFVIISIKDNGCGMPESVKNRIFEPFYTTKDVGEGTGLGLSISYGIIEKHKGKITVHSEIGKGTEFIISIPIVQRDM